MKALILPFAVWIAGAGSAFANDLVDVPEGCMPTVTIQRNSCSVSTIMQCGKSHIMTTHSRGTLSDTHQFGAQWDLVGYEADKGVGVFSAAPGSKPEVSLADLFETGTSTGQRTMLFNSRVVKDRKIEMDSNITLSGEEVELSGQTFLAGTVDRTFILNPKHAGMKVSFDILMSKSGDLMIEGKMTRTDGDDVEVFDMSPVSVVWPGEEGFLSTTAQNGCGE